MASRRRQTAARRAPGPSRARAPPRPAAQARTPPQEQGPLAWSDLSATRLRALAERPTLAAALLFALLVLAYLWPVLLGGKILSANAILYAFSPWNGYLPHDIDSYANVLLTDVPMVDYPWRALARVLLHQGTFPAWNPYVFAGTPFYSNPQTGIFSLFSLPLWILPLNYGIGVGAALKLWVGGFGTYLLVRQLRLGFLPGLLAGTGFAFSALNIVWLTHETLPAVAVMLPWAIWLVERICERERLGSALGLALVTAIALGGGHPGMQVHVLVVIGLYVLARVALMRGMPRAQRLRALALAGGGMLIGTALMAVMLVPELFSSHGTIGTVARHSGTGTLPGTRMPLTAIRTTVLPDWWGRPSALEAETPPGVPNYNERAFYAGVVTLLLACVGLLTRRGWNAKAPFAVLGVVGLAVPLHAPGLYWLATHLPVLQDVQSQRLHFAYAFAVAVLAAFGLRELLERPADERRRLLVPLAAGAVGLAAIADSGANAADAGHVVTHFLTGADYGRPSVLALTSVAWLLLFALGVGVGLLALRRWPRHRIPIATAIVLLAALDMLHFAHGYQPMGPESKVIPPRTPAIAYLQRHARGTRFIGSEHVVTNDWSLLYGLHDVRGYDPPYPTLRFYRLWLEAEPEQTNWKPFTIEVASPAALRVMSVLGAGYLAAAPGAPLPHLAPPLRPLVRVYAGRDATIFANPNAVPRAIVASTVEPTAAEEATRGALVAEGFDPRRTVVVERDQPGAAALTGAPGASGTVAVTHESNASVTLTASLRRGGLVVLNDQLTAGWTVRVDGHAARPLRVNDVMRGVVAPAGKHEIVWSYAVPGLRVGLVVSLLALLGLAGGGGVVLVRARRRR